MCGRYFFGDEEKSAEMKQMIETLTRKVGADRMASIKTKGEVFPSDVVPVLSGGNVCAMQWGFVQNDGRMLINARSETVSAKPMFKRSFQEGRCLIPAAGYYEWRAGDGPRKLKYAMTSDDPTIYMAAICRMEYDSKFPRFVILTRDAVPDIAHIHDRMPVILAGEHRRAWLLGDNPQSVLKNCVSSLHIASAR